MKLTLREWRRLKEITQAQMAAVCGVTPATYQAWEKKPSEIKISIAIKIAERLGITLDDLILEP